MHTATTEIYTLFLHDALPISPVVGWDNLVYESPLRVTRTFWRHYFAHFTVRGCVYFVASTDFHSPLMIPRSEEHTSELQSLRHLVCRLLLEKKKKTAVY